MSVTLLSSSFQQVQVQGFPLFTRQDNALRGEIVSVHTNPGVPVDYRFLAAKHPIISLHLYSIQSEMLLLWVICGQLDHHVVVSCEVALGHSELSLENIRPVAILVKLNSWWVPLL